MFSFVNTACIITSMIKNDIQEPPFLWGVTHIAPQVEAACLSNDWHYASCSGHVPSVGSGDEYLSQYVEHHDHVEALGCNALRVSVEWARIEPEEGVFDDFALQHYRKIFLDLKRRDIHVVLGLFHWSLPIWFATRYGMKHPRAREKFAVFMERVCAELGDVVDVVVILNEPMVYVGTGYLRGQRPPFRSSVIDAYRTVRNLIGIHRDTYDHWKKVYPQASVGSTHLWNDIQARDSTNVISDKILYLMECASAYFRVHYVVRRTRDRSDYLGINYYTSNTFYLGKKDGKWGLHTTNDWHSPDVWRHFAHGFGCVLRSAAKYGLPLYVMENGKPSNPGTEDADRQELLSDHVAVMRQKKQSLDIMGYFHHSLMDCYEWDSGYDFKFGLIEVDRDTLALRRRESFSTYRGIISKYL